MSDYEKLTPRELDAAVAERLFNLERAGSWLPQLPRYISPEQYYYNFPAKDYSTDDGSVRLVRDRIAELGLWGAFVRALGNTIELLPYDLAMLSMESAMQRCMQATPRQQCLAALMALEVK